jgi:hypothetical protein
MLFLAAFGIAGFVFAIQALVVGVDTYNLPGTMQNVSGIEVLVPNCQRTVGLWLVVYGSLMISNVGLTCICPAQKNEDGESNGNFCSNLVSLACFGWLCYGVNIISAPGNYPNADCSPSQYGVFVMMVNFMFWGGIALIVGSIFLVCISVPIVALGEQQPRAAAARAPPAQAPAAEAPPPPVQAPPVQAPPVQASAEKTSVEMV